MTRHVPSKYTLFNSNKHRVTIDKFYNNIRRCSKYDEVINNYQRYLKVIISRCYREYNEQNQNTYLEIFHKIFDRDVTYRSVLKRDKAEFDDICCKSANYFNDFIYKYKINEINQKYNFKNYVIGDIDGIIIKDGKEFILGISYKNEYETLKILDFYHLNSYFYNKAKEKTLDTIVFSVISNAFFVLYYDRDLDISTRLLTQSKKNQVVAPGHWCINCRNKCRALLIKDLERFEGLIL